MIVPISKSGYYCANKIARITFQSLCDMMGDNDLKSILNLGQLQNFVENFPPDNYVREVDFADFSAFNWAMEEMYGMRGSRVLALKAGRSVFMDAVRNFGALAGVNDPAFKVLPPQAKLRIGLPAMAKIFSQISDEFVTVQEQETEIIYTVQRCTDCWGRCDADKPVCFFTIGLLQEALKWLSGGNEFRVNESKCSAMGSDVCEFLIQKAPIH